MDLDNLRAIRATLIYAFEGFDGGHHDNAELGKQSVRDYCYTWIYRDEMKAINRAINELDATLPVVTDAEALAALCA